MTQPTVTYQGQTYKVRGKIDVPDLDAMAMESEWAPLQWLIRHTYARGYSRPTVSLPPIGVIVR